MKRPRSGRQLAAVAPLQSRSEPVASARVGRVVGVSAQGRPLVDFPGNQAGPLEAVTTSLTARADLEAAAGRRQQVVLLFDGGDPRAPIVVGFVVPAVQPAERPEEALPPAEARQELPEVAEVDGKRVCIEGMDEVVLRCGEASITLRRNGKVVIRGAYLESHSKGTNRIKGGSVQIN